MQIAPTVAPAIIEVLLDFCEVGELEGKAEDDEVEDWMIEEVVDKDVDYEVEDERGWTVVVTGWMAYEL